MVSLLLAHRLGCFFCQVREPTRPLVWIPEEDASNPEEDASNAILRSLSSAMYDTHPMPSSIPFS